MKHALAKIARAAVVTALITGAVAMAQMPETASPKNAKVYFANLKDGDIVTGPVKIVMGLSGMGIAPAGIEFPDTGHHHLVIDAPTPNAGEPIPADDTHVHFGKGQTEVTLNLEPGRHTLQLVLADRNHVPHKPAVVSPVIMVLVR